jgi:hypothetical protein
LNPWPRSAKYAVVLDEQPIPDIFAMRCGGMDIS